MFSISDLPMVGILRGINKKDIPPLTELFIQNNLKHIEVTMNTLGAAELIKSFKTAGKGELMIGAGTVTSLNLYDEARKAGAEFIVSPTVIPELIVKCVTEHIPVFPGALTPTEVQTAWELGATMVKLFPASAFGPGYIKALKGPFDKLKVMAVGGVNIQNIENYFANGADAVAFGAGLVKPDLLVQNKYEEIDLLLKNFIAAYKKENIV